MRKFKVVITVSLILLGLLFMLGMPLAAEGKKEEVVIRYAGTAAASMENPEYLAMLKLKEVAEEKSNGKIKVEVYPANQLGATKEFTEGVSMGTVEMAVTGYSMMGLMDKRAFVLELPFMYRDLDHFIEVVTGPIGEEINQRLIKTTGIKVLGVLDRGARQVMNKERPIRRPEDLKGLKIRSPESPVNFETIRAMGAIPITMTWSEVYTALSQGVADGVENTIEELYNQKLHEVQKYISLTKHIFLGVTVVINDEFFNKLPEEYQQIILDATKESVLYRREMLKTSEAAALDEMRKSGIEVITDPDYEAFASRANEVYKQFVDGNDITWDLIKQIREYHK